MVVHFGVGRMRRHKRPASELCILTNTVRSFILTTGKQHDSRREFVPQRENSQQFVLSINGESLSFPFPLCTPEGPRICHIYNTNAHQRWRTLNFEITETHSSVYSFFFCLNCQSHNFLFSWFMFPEGDFIPC